MSDLLKTKITELRDQVEKAAEKLQFLETLDKAFEANPELIALVKDAVASKDVIEYQTPEQPTPTTKAKLPKRKSGGAAVRGKSIGQLFQWFERNKNHPATIDEMAAAISVGRSGIRQMVYTTYPDRFEKTGKKAETRESLFVPKKGSHP